MATNNYPKDLRDISLVTIEAVTPEDLQEAETTIEWIVDDVIPTKGVALLGGYQGEGKTTLLTQIAFSIATGLPLFDEVPEKGPGKVVIIGFETSIADFKRRIAKISEQYQAAGVSVDQGLVDANLLLFKENTSELETILIEEELEHVGQKAISQLALSDLHKINRVIEDEIRMIIVDPLSGLGLGDELSPAASYPMFRSLRILHTQNDNLVVLAHHLIKSSHDEPLLKRLDYSAVRGGVHMTATPRIVLMLVKLTQKEVRRAKLPALSDGCYAVLGLEKFNEGPYPVRILLRGTADGLWQRHPDDQALARLLSGAATRPEDDSSPGITKKESLLVKLHEQESGAGLDMKEVAKDIFSTAKSSEAALRSAMRHLVHDGLIQSGTSPQLTEQGIRLVAQIVSEGSDT